MVVVPRVHLWRDADIPMSQGKQGGNTGGIEYSPAKAKRRAAARKNQDRRWASRSGPVTVTKVEGCSDAHAVDQDAGQDPAAASEARAGGSPGPLVPS